MLYACKGVICIVRTPSSPVRERERERDKEREGEGERGGEREKKSDVGYVQNCYFYF